MKRLRLRWRHLALIGTTVIAIAFYIFHVSFLAQFLHENWARRAFTSETAVISQAVAGYGVKFEFDRHICNNLDGDSSVIVSCRFYRDGEMPIDQAFIDAWPNHVDSLVRVLEANDWQRQPNGDPVTQNPVDRLERLLEYKGKYSAKVDYQKRLGTTTCTASFQISSSKPIAQFVVRQSCASNSSEWF